MVSKFLGNKKDPNYKSIMGNMLDNFQKLGCRMNIKAHFLHFHLDVFPSNLGAVGEEQGKRFHKDIKILETRYHGRWDCSMMANYCWPLKRDCHQSDEPGRKTRKRRFMPRAKKAKVSASS